MRLRCCPRTVAALLCLGLTGSLLGTPVEFSGSSGNLSASVLFDDSVAGTLIVTLSNTSPNDVLVPIDVLTGVFWDSSVALTLTRSSAVVPGSSTVYFCGGSCPAGGVVGGEWAYNSGLAGPGATAYGISSAGLGLVGPGDRFPGPNLQGPDSPDGLQYGILPAGDNTATGNAPVTGDNALILNSVIFTLTGLPAGFDAQAAISNVQFQYGTALSEPSFPGDPGGGGGGGSQVPEPATMSLLGGGGLLLLIAKRLKRRR
ncbi:MAG: XDD4 family exosortase-dependent surface protein [Bryobacteraceae bacterium]